jgi:hypothetical protein
MKMIKVPTRKPKQAPRLSPVLMQRLVDKYRRSTPGIKSRLESLWEFEKSTYVGTMHSSTPHDNAIAYAMSSGLKLAVGYIIQNDHNSKGIRMDLHSWIIDSNNKVFEPTKGITWGPSVRYCGMPVPEGQIENKAYLNMFTREQHFVSTPNPLKGI